MCKTIFLGIIFGLLLGITSVAGAQDLIMGYVLVEYYDGIAGSTIDDLLNSAFFRPEPQKYYSWSHLRFKLIVRKTTALGSGGISSRLKLVSTHSGLPVMMPVNFGSVRTILMKTGN
jgi:hypothetical protein